jgi:surfactin synthase thioesterase subunit
MTADQLWLRRFQPVANPRIVLVCLPHAGGAASFFLPLSRSLPDGIELAAVQYPGRQDRYREPPSTSIGPLAGRLAEVVAETPGLVLFGHSMGAIVAFEAVRLLEQRGERCLGMVASGCRAPSLTQDNGVHRKDDAGLILETRRLGGTDTRVLDDDEMRAHILPALRADYTAIETYRAEPGAVVHCPVSVLIGDADDRVSVAAADEWRTATTGPFSRDVFRGGHFFLSARPAEVRDTVCTRIAAFERLVAP